MASGLLGLSCLENITYLRMISDDISLWGEPQDSWCDKYIWHRRYRAIGEPLWGGRSSAMGGLVLRQVVALRAAEVYLPLWPAHWGLLCEQAALMGFSPSVLGSPTDMRDEIKLLASRNHYPAHSLAHIVLWLDVGGAGLGLDHAIFQSRLDQSPFVVGAEPLFLLEASASAIVNDGFGSWADAPVETLAAGRARQEALAGACLMLPDRRLARTTLGNIFFIMPGGRVVGVGRNARPDALCRFVREKRLFEQFRMTYEEVDGVGQPIVTEALECFVCDSAIGLRPVMSIGTAKRFYTKTGTAFAAALRDMVIV